MRLHNIFCLFFLLVFLCGLSVQSEEIAISIDNFNEQQGMVRFEVLITNRLSHDVVLVNIDKPLFQLVPSTEGRDRLITELVTVPVPTLTLSTGLVSKGKLLHSGEYFKMNVELVLDRFCNHPFDGDLIQEVYFRKWGSSLEYAKTIDTVVLKVGWIPESLLPPENRELYSESGWRISAEDVLGSCCPVSELQSISAMKFNTSILKPKQAITTTKK